MNLNEKVNKIKITLFGNIWVARIVKLFLYLSVVLITWLVSKIELLFSVPPQTLFRTVLEWRKHTFKEASGALFTLALAGLLIFAYFCLISWLIKWLFRIDISSQQKKQILQEKVYNLDEKTSYSVEKFDNLEATAFRNLAAYSSLKGTLSLDNQKQKKTINFVCNFSGNLENLEASFPRTSVKYRTKTFWNWKILVGAILLLGSLGYFYQVKDDINKLHDYPLERILLGKAEIQKQIADKKKAEDEQEEKKKRYERAKITDPNDIDITFNSIGGLREIKKDCESNAELIRIKNTDPKSIISSPEHMIFFGPPGTGKTMLARAIARASGSFFLNLNGNDFSAGSIGEELSGKATVSPEEKIRTVFNIAVQEADGKTIVALIDEIDQMGSNFKAIGREFQSILEDRRYKNIIVIATTNYLGALSNALLRPGRIFKKFLVSYPSEKDLLEITKMVLGDLHSNLNKDHPELFGNLGKDAFVNKFAKKIWEEMKKSKYEIKYGDMGAKPGDKLDPEKGRILFTGADVRQVVFKEATGRVSAEGRKTLKEEDFKEGIRKVFKYNKETPWWLESAENYLVKEIATSRDQDDRREKKKGPSGPQGPGPQ